MAKSSEESQSDVVMQEGDTKPKEPPQFAVVLHNDDYTPMDFVVEVLRRYFRKAEADAMHIMMQVHQKGRGVAGIYHFEIAETKVSQVHEYAQSEGHPLKCSMEPAP